MRGWLGIARIATAAACAVSAAPAFACSVSDEYRVPTNLELTAEADTILLGTVEAGTVAAPGLDEPRLSVRPILLLKGPHLPSEVRLPGTIATGRDVVLSDPAELRNAHPQSYSGPCVRTTFIPGSTILLFLKRTPDGLAPIRRSFARVAEDVPSPDSRWVKAVRLYVEIAALPVAERRAALLDRRRALLASEDADSRAIAADIRRQLKPNRRWNAIMDEAIRYRRY